MERELKAGDLVPALPQAPELESAERYYLVWPNSRADYPPLQAFRAWLQDAAQAFWQKQSQAQRGDSASRTDISTGSSA